MRWIGCEKIKYYNTMSKICQITGKKAMGGCNVSHSKRHTKRTFDVNLFRRKFYWVEQDTWIELNVSAAGLRTINKIGLDAALKNAAEKGYLYKKKGGETMAKKSKEARVQVILECTEQKASGVPGMSRYITTKNRKNTPERLELKKYNPYLKKYTIHKEIK